MPGNDCALLTCQDRPCDAACVDGQAAAQASSSRLATFCCVTENLSSISQYDERGYRLLTEHHMHAKKVLSAAVFISKRPPDARAYLSIVDCPAFLQAVADGNAAAVEEFHNDGVGILHKVIPNCFGEACIDAWGDGPVHWAVRNKHPDILRRLIGRGWLVDEEGKHGDTPLCVASEDESAAACECINILSIAGVRTEHGGSSGVPPLLRAVAMNNILTARALLVGGASIAGVHPQSGLSAIEIARCEEMRTLLLNPPEVSPWNSTGLFKAPQLKKKKKGAAWSVERLRVDAPDPVNEVAAPLTEEEIEEARKAARAEARAKRRAATIAAANLGLSMTSEAGNEENVDTDYTTTLSEVIDKAAVARIASMIQFNVKKDASVLECDDTSASVTNSSMVANCGDEGSDLGDLIPMASAAIETWGGLVMRCAGVASSIQAVDFGFQAESQVVIEGMLPSEQHIPTGAAVSGIVESVKLAQLQQSISSWMAQRGQVKSDVEATTQQTSDVPQQITYSHHLACSKPLALGLTSELLGDNCSSQEEADNSMCFVMQWQLHISRAFLRQDGVCVHMPPLMSSADAKLLRSITMGPPPTLVEARANPNAKNGVPLAQSFVNCQSEQWLVSDSTNTKAMKISVECSNRNVEAVVLGSSCCLLRHLQTMQGLVAVRARGSAIATLLMQSHLLSSDDTPIGVKRTIWKAMKPLQFTIAISCHALLPDTRLRMFSCRAAPLAAEEFPDDTTDSDLAWPRLQQDDAVLRVHWGESVSIKPNENKSDCTGTFDWPLMPAPYVVQSQMQYGNVHLGVKDLGLRRASHNSPRFVLRPTIFGWRWRQVNMATAAAPEWYPVDSREDVLSVMEIEEGINVTSMADDEIECPVVCDAVWHTLTSEPDGAAKITAAAAARALAETLNAGKTEEEANIAVEAAKSLNTDLLFARWALCCFANGDFAAALPYKLPVSFVAQAADIPYETTVHGQYRVGCILPLAASDAVRIFNTLCHIGPSVCIQPSKQHASLSAASSGDLSFSSAVLNPNVCLGADGSSSSCVYLECGPDPNEVRKLKLLQAELSQFERELMEVVSHRAFKERGGIGDKELSWDEIGVHLVALRIKEEQLRARIAANKSAIKKDKGGGVMAMHDRLQLRRGTVVTSADHLQDELSKEHAGLLPVILLDSRVSELRESRNMLSESASKQHVIVWSRWSKCASAHTSPEPPLVDMPFSDAVASYFILTKRFYKQLSCLQQLCGPDERPLQSQKIFELPKFMRPNYFNPRLLEKTISSKHKECPPPYRSIAPDPPTRGATRCISPGPLDGLLDVHVTSAADAQDAVNLQREAATALGMHAPPFALCEAKLASPSRASTAPQGSGGVGASCSTLLPCNTTKAAVQDDGSR